jgi:hypothetical protein
MNSATALRTVTSAYSSHGKAPTITRDKAK